MREAVVILAPHMRGEQIVQRGDLMIETLSHFPSQVAAFRCSGRVTRREYEIFVIPAVRKALEARERIRLYYETAPDFSIDAGAAWEDFKIGMEHLTHWDRIAVVSDIDWIRHTMRAFGFLLPGRLKVFPLSDVAQAREWITAETSK
jgi:SpoIIAA-like